MTPLHRMRAAAYLRKTRKDAIRKKEYEHIGLTVVLILVLVLAFLWAFFDFIQLFPLD